MKICIFGDSITEGFYDDEKGGWVNRLKILRKDDEIFNLGIAGDTTNDLLARIDADIEDKKPDMIVFAIGINDSIYLPAEKRNYVEFEKFKENLKRLIEKAKAFSDNIIFVGLTPVDENLTMPIEWEAEMYYTNDEVGKYDDAIKEICKKEGLKFVDIFSEMIEIDYVKLISDGVHPNAQGHEWMSRIINLE